MIEKKREKLFKFYYIIINKEIIGLIGITTVAMTKRKTTMTMKKIMVSEKPNRKAAIYFRIHGVQSDTRENNSSIQNRYINSV